VAFTADNLTSCLPGLGSEFGLLALDPAQACDNCQPNRFIVDPQGRRHTYAAIRRIDAKVQIADVLTDDLHLYPADRDLLLVLALSSTHAAT
jgi:hypothetical protein